ncbi:MAG: DUF2752 domain-containing protein [Myxococcales bacterium]|nr:DUF2752 domain-containing protein [Myxococcales bacterium]
MESVSAEHDAPTIRQQPDGAATARPRPPSPLGPRGGAERGADCASRGSLASLLGWSVLLLGPLAVLTTAALLRPDPSGHGTHTQLGLPPCGFHVVTGLPCPGCGMTTSFAHMVRLEIVPAALANPFGVPLALLTAACVPLALFGIARRLPVLETLERLRVEMWAILLACTLFLVWIVRLATTWLLR